MAVPVVSEPVPAVVGTLPRRQPRKEGRGGEREDVLAMSGRRVCVIGSPFPTGAFMKSYRSASGYTENLLDKG